MAKGTGIKRCTLEFLVFGIYSMIDSKLHRSLAVLKEEMSPSSAG